MSFMEAAIATAKASSSVCVCVCAYVCVYVDMSIRQLSYSCVQQSRVQTHHGHCVPPCVGAVGLWRSLAVHSSVAVMAAVSVAASEASL